MSKRGADGQGDKHTGLPADRDQEETPVKATAAQMAGRRILSTKSRRTAGGGSPGLFNPGSSLQALGNPFANLDQNTVNGGSSQSMATTGFGQQQNGFAFGSTQPPNNDSNKSMFGSPASQSASFPPAQANSSNIFGGFQSSAPTGSFSFSAGTNNPFSQSGSKSFGRFGQTNGTIEAASQESAQQSNAGNGTDMQISPPTTPSKGVNSATTASIFGTMTGNPTFQPQNSNVFGQMQLPPQHAGSSNAPPTSSSAPPTNPFSFNSTAATQPPKPAFTFGQPAQSSESQATLSRPQPATFNPFAAPTQKSDASPISSVQKTTPFNMFAGEAQGNVNPPSSTSGAQKSDAAAASSTPAPIASTNLFQSAPTSTGFGSNSSTSPFKTSTMPTASSSNLFQPPAESPFKNTAPGVTSATPQTFGNDLFSRATKPTEAVQVKATSNLFGNLQKTSEESTTPPQPETKNGGYPALPSMGSAAPSTKTNSVTSGSPTQVLGAAPPSLSDAQSEAYKSHLDLRSLNAGYQKTLANLDMHENWATLMRAYISQSDKLLNVPSATTGNLPSAAAPQLINKRKADETLPADSPKRSRANEVPVTSPSKVTAVSPGRSQTSNLFQSIVDNKESMQPTTPSKPSSSSTAPSTTPAGPPPSNFFTSRPDSQQTSTSSFGAKAANNPQPDFSNSTAPLQPTSSSNLFTSDKSSSAVAPNPVFSQPTIDASRPPNLFQSKPADNGASSNPFGSIMKTPLTPSANSFVAKPAATSSNPLNASLFQAKPTMSSTPTMNKSSIFSPDSVQSSAKVSESMNKSVAPTQPPQFGGLSTQNTFNVQPVSQLKNNEGSGTKISPVVAKIPSISKFGAAAGPSTTNFMSQFGSQAAKSAAEAKLKRKAEDFDSEEEDEEEWERKYEEEQQRKKEQAAATSAISLPKFGASTASPNFISQFGSQAAQTEAEMKKKRKAEEFDSEEDDEAEWERNYEEEQRKKKAKNAEQPAPVHFVPGQGFKMGASQTPSAKTSGFTNNGPRETLKPPPSGTSVFSSSYASPNTNPANSFQSSNIFAHLSDAGSNATSDNDDDADSDGAEDDDARKGVSVSRPVLNRASNIPAEDTDDETLEDTMRKNARNQTSGKSLFDRVTPADQSAAGKSSPGGNGSQTNPFSLGGTTNGTITSTEPSKSSNMFGSYTSPTGDHTWKNDSPIKFGNSAPVFNFTPATPTKSTVGNGTESTAPTSRPFQGLFSSAKPNPSTSLFGQASAATADSSSSSNAFGYSFGGPPKSDLPTTSPFLFAPSASTPGSGITSVTTSRATSPGGGGEDGDDEGEAPVAQSDFTAMTAEELRDEDVLFEVAKARCMLYNKAATQPWEVKGTGPLRVLKNKGTGATRILLRIAPSGKVVINSRVQKAYSYSHAGKGTTRLMIAGAGGKPETWGVKMGKDEDAKRFAEVCEEEKGA